MTRITISCNHCGDSITSHSVAEAAAWNREHDGQCIAPRLPTTPGSVIRSDALLMRTRWDNWVADHGAVLTDKDVTGEPFTVLFDAGQKETA